MSTNAVEFLIGLATVAGLFLFGFLLYAGARSRKIATGSRPIVCAILNRLAVGDATINDILASLEERQLDLFRVELLIILEEMKKWGAITEFEPWKINVGSGIDRSRYRLTEKGWDLIGSGVVG